MVAVRTVWGPITGFTQLDPAIDTTVALNDADDAAGMIFVAEKDGTVDHLGFYATAINGTPPQYNVGLVTVSAAGDPTQTAFGGSASQAHTFSAGWNDITLATPATVNAGDFIAVHAWPTGTPPDGTNHAVVRVCLGTSATDSLGLPLGKEFSTLWLDRAPAVPGMSYRYSTGEWAVPVAAGEMLGPNYDSADTPDEYGALLEIPFDATCFGVRVYVDAVNSGSWTVKLYDSDGSTALATWTIDADIITLSQVFDLFCDGLSLVSGTGYRIGITNDSPTDATLRVQRLPVAVAAHRAAWPEGSRWQETTRTDAGAWSQTDTVIPIMGLWLSDIDIPAPAAGVVAGIPSIGRIG